MMGILRWFRRDRKVVVRTVTYGRKLPIERGGNAEYILTAHVKSYQTPEEVMGGLRKIVRCQLEEVRNIEGDYNAWGDTVN
jgi:hypothetical protein